MINSKWIKSGSFSLLNRISITFFGLLNFYFLVRIFSQEHMGYWLSFLSIITITESIRNAFIYNPLIRYLNSHSSEDRTIIISSSLFLNLSSAGLVSLTMITLYFLLVLFLDSPILGNMILTYAIGAFGFAWFSHYNFLQQSELKFKGTFLSFFLNKVIILSYILIKFFGKEELELAEMALVYSLAYIPSIFVSLWFARSYRSMTYSLERKWIILLAQYGKYTFGTNVSAMVDKSMSDWLLLIMLGPKAVAIFNPAIRVANLFEVPLGAISAVFYPEMVKRAKEGGTKAAKEMYEKTMAIILIVLIPFVIVTFIFAEQIIVFIADEQYIESADLLRIAIFFGLFVPFLRQFGVTMNAIGKANVNFYFVIITAALGIFIKFVMIYLLGVYGAVYGSLLSFVIFSIAVLFVLKEKIDVDLKNVFIYMWETIESSVNRIKRLK